MSDEQTQDSIKTVSLRERGRKKEDTWLPHVESTFTVKEIVRLHDPDDYDILVLKTEQDRNVLVDECMEGVDIDNPDTGRLLGGTFEHVTEGVSPYKHHHLVRLDEEPDWVMDPEERNPLTL